MGLNPLNPAHRAKASRIIAPRISEQLANSGFMIVLRQRCARLL